MSLRWHKDGTLICGAKSQPEVGDCYINDRLHYMLSIILKVIEPDEDEEETGLWHWIMDQEGMQEYERINTKHTNKESRK